MSRRNWTRATLFVLGPLLVIGLATGYYLHRLGHVSTEDAYVKADMVSIAADVPGRIVEVLVAVAVTQDQISGC